MTLDFVTPKVDNHIWAFGKKKHYNVIILTVFKISNPSVTRLSPTKGASASAPAEEKVNKNIQNYSHRNVPTVVSSARSSLHCSVAANSHDRQAYFIFVTTITTAGCVKKFSQV